MKEDVRIFESNLEHELYDVWLALCDGSYVHGGYENFFVNDPKRRIIHKASVRDRVVHRLLYNYLLPIFHSRWLDCSFSCRPGFGQHRAIANVQSLIVRASKNYRVPCRAVKLDIKKFFEHIDHIILLRLLARRVNDPLVLKLMTAIITSYSVTEHVGLPIGNLTSQVFANIYLHELDWFIKHELRMPYYARYADDFVCFVEDVAAANLYIEHVSRFLETELRLTVHPKKIVVRPVAEGIDWLGVVVLPWYSVLRPTTRRRMIKRMRTAIGSGHDSEYIRSMMASYHGLLVGTARVEMDRVTAQLGALASYCT